MIFIVSRSWRCATLVAEREELTRPQWLAWTAAHSAVHKIRGVDEPKVWISDCALGVLTQADMDMIATRRAHLTRVRCGS